MSAPAELLAPRFARVGNFVIFIVMELTLVLIATYPPFRPAQTIIAGLVGLVVLLGICRVLRAGYVTTDTHLILRGVLRTRTIPKEEIVGFLAASMVQHRDSYGSVEIVSFFIFREDRLGREQRLRALIALRTWLGEPQGGVR
jgi:uncharacterized membrane protein YdbT with pleckstrin-like domain